MMPVFALSVRVDAGAGVSRPGLSRASVALRVLSPGGQLAEVLESSAGYPASPHPYQANIARNCFRFMDSQVGTTHSTLPL